MFENWRASMAVDSEATDPLPGRIDFHNTEFAFAHLSDRELKRMYYLFRLMNSPALVNVGSSLLVAAIRLRLPLVKRLVRHTIFRQFVGGETLQECEPVIEKLRKYQCSSILEYGAEGKSREEELDATRDIVLNTIRFAASSDSVPVVSLKLTGLVDNALLEKKQRGEVFSEQEDVYWKRFLRRFDDICQTAYEHNIALFIDAEESWMQDAIDALVLERMRRYNTRRAILYNTYQLYRVDGLQRLKDDYRAIHSEGYVFGAKLVRGAYMDKERKRAKEMGYPSPIHPTKAATDRAYDEAILFCVEHFETMASCNASHNLKSNALQAKLIEERGIVKNHDHLNFSQLYGMADYITFNLSARGYNVAKYLPYGPVEEVLPYLIRRARENTAVTGDMSRELKYLRRELKRRGLLR